MQIEEIYEVLSFNKVLNDYPLNRWLNVEIRYNKTSFSSKFKIFRLC